MYARHTTVSERRTRRARRKRSSGSAGGVTRLVAATVGRPDLRNGALSLVDQAVVSGASFATNVIIGRLCSKEDLGVFYLAMTVVCLARGMQEQLISAPYVIYCQRRRDAALASYSGSALVHALGLSGAVNLVLLGLLAMLSLGIGPAGLAPAAWVLLGTLPLLLLREFIRRMTIAHLQMGVAIALDAGIAVLQIGSLLALAYFGRLSVATTYGAMGLACAVACGGWFIGKRWPMHITWSRVVVDWRHNWGFARWALVSHLIGSATLYLMPWIVTMARGRAEAGALAACVSLIGMASMFVTGVATYLTPRAAMAYAHGGVAQLRHVLRLAAAIYAGVLGAFTVFVLASGDFLLVLVFGGKYAGYGAVMGLLAVSMTALSMGVTAGNGLWAIDRPKANFSADVWTLTVTLALLFCLVQPYGIVGAAMADLGGNVSGALVRYGTLRRLLRTVRQTAEPQ